MSHDRDRELGMHCSITRRDFLNGFALGTAGALTAPRWLYGLDLGEAGGGGGEYYPPALTGLRGSHVGSFEVAHSLRDGTFWKTAGEPEDTGESYDLVVVGGGLSGLSAAHFFRKETGGRVLILENHDDFGGHAKRNEFTQAGGRFLLGFGGTWSIDSAGPYSALAQSLIKELGIDVTRWAQVVDPKVYGSLGLGRGFFFDKETFGADRLLPDPVHFGGGEEGPIAGTAGDPWPAPTARSRSR
jgi:spermidine dehydrogenase